MDKERTVELTRDEYSKLAEKLGFYEIDWYFVDKNTIKFWDGKKWQYAKKEELLKGVV